MSNTKRIILNLVPLIVFITSVAINRVINCIDSYSIYGTKFTLAIYFWTIAPIYFSVLNYKFVNDFKSFFMNYIFIMSYLSLLLMMVVAVSYIEKTGLYANDGKSYAISVLLMKFEYIASTVIWLIIGGIKLIIITIDRKNYSNK